MADRTDILRIIAAKKKRLEDLSNPSVWERITRHMEGGELREFKQSCVDDEIIIEILEKSLKERDNGIKEFVEQHKEIMRAFLYSDSMDFLMKWCEYETNTDNLMREMVGEDDG